MKDAGPDLCMNFLVLFYLTASGDLTPEAFLPEWTRQKRCNGETILFRRKGSDNEEN